MSDKPFTSAELQGFEPAVSGYVVCQGEKTSMHLRQIWPRVLETTAALERAQSALLTLISVTAEQRQDLERRLGETADRVCERFTLNVKGFEGVKFCNKASASRVGELVQDLREGGSSASRHSASFFSAAHIARQEEHQREKAEMALSRVRELTQTLYDAVQQGAGCCGEEIGRGSRLRQILDEFNRLEVGAADVYTLWQVRAVANMWAANVTRSNNADDRRNLDEIIEKVRKR